ncbi:MAG TPA: selenide, water dikinase SelD [Acidimicrobiales bacterium]
MISSEFKLTEWTSCGGCAAKWPGGRLSGLLGSVGNSDDPDLILGLAPFDDAAVYRLRPDLALVATTDFFPPLVDDPSDFGAIAAANACSDIFAMGGRVVLALNVAAFPEEFPERAIESIFSSASEVVRSAGGTVAGGHTIRAAEPIFGLAVQGLVHPERIWSKGGARPGNVLMLSKPVGSGIVLAAGTPEERSRAIAVMRTLNVRAADDLHELEADRHVHSVTDVTGFGLAGHCWEIAERSGIAVQILSSDVPLFEGVPRLARDGTRTGGHARNRAYLGENLAGDVPDHIEAIVLDPQTSGGLLAAVDPSCEEFLSCRGWSKVGRAVEGGPGVELVG